MGNSFEQGQGRLYGTLPLEVGRSIVQPAGWSGARLKKLRTHLESVERSAQEAQGTGD